MMTNLMMLYLSIMISTGLMMLCTTISKKTMYDREKSTPFECGFDPKSSSRMPFSMQFFLIAIIFLIFDLEIIIIIPSIYTMQTSNMSLWYLTMTSFIMILIMGLYHEWKEGALQWSK